MLRSIAARPPSSQIVIVDIDERSLAAVGQWPWRRDVMAQLVGRLRDLGASVVALDIIFAEADRYQTTGAAFDDVLADTLRAGRVVLGYALTFDRTDEPSTECVQHSLGLPIVRRFAGSADTDAPFFRATQAICNLPALTTAASSSGFLNAAPDPDGILRRAPLLMELNGRVYPSLALAAVAAATAVREPALHVVNVNTSRLVLDTRTVPLDGKANLLLRYRGPKRTFTYVSARRCSEEHGGFRDDHQQDRAGRNHGVRHTRGRGNTSRYAVCGSRSPGNGRRQSAAAGFRLPS